MIEDRLAPNVSYVTAADVAETLEQAQAALAEGHTDAAFTLYRSLLTEGASGHRDFGHLDALLGLGVCHARRREWAEALIPLRELCDRAPTFAPGWAYLGAAKFELGEIDAACADLDTAIACEPESAIARLKRAEVRFSLGQLDAAEEDARVAARAPAPDEATRQYARELLMSLLRLKKRAAPRASASPSDALRGLKRLARGLVTHG